MKTLNDLQLEIFLFHYLIYYLNLDGVQEYFISFGRKGMHYEVQGTNITLNNYRMQQLSYYLIMELISMPKRITMKVLLVSASSHSFVCLINEMGALFLYFEILSHFLFLLFSY